MEPAFDKMIARLEAGRHINLPFFLQCLFCGVNPIKMDKYIKEHFGFSGREMVRIYRNKNEKHRQVL